MPWIAMAKGARQGSPLSLLLFNIFLTLRDIEKLKTNFKAKLRLYAVNIIAKTQTAKLPEELYKLLIKVFDNFGITINYGPNKNFYMQTSPAKHRHTGKIGNLERVESYQYLGCLISTDKRNS